MAGCTVLLQAFEIMEQELGRPIAEVFSCISERPIAAASLGQVCVGRWRPLRLP